MQQLKISNTYILSFLIVFIFSCNRKNTETQSESSEMGQLVSNLGDKIWAVYQDQKGNYWFGSNGDGVFVYNDETIRKFTVEDGLMDNTIRDIQEDKLGNIFIGTPSGVSKYDGSTFTNLKPIVSSSNEWKSAPDDLWFNCNGNALYRYDGASLFELTLPRKNLKEAFGKEVQGVPFEGMNNSSYAVYGIDKDSAGNIWFGTVTAGVFRYDGESFLWIAEQELSTLPDGRVPGVRSIVEDRDGNFWLSNFISRYRINDNGTTVNYEKLEGIDKSTGHFKDRIPYFNSGLRDDNGDLWMTTYTGGVWKYDGEKLHNFPVTDGGTEALLISIYKDNEGVLWLGTDNAGVYKFNGEVFEKFLSIE